MFTVLEVEAEMMDADVDAVDEIRLRTWARQNYCSFDDRDETWHPVVLDEMERMDAES